MTAGASRPPVPVAPPGAVSGAVPAEVAAWLAAGRTALAVAGRADEWSAVERQAVLAELTRVERLTAMLRGLALAYGFAVIPPQTSAAQGDEVPLVRLPLVEGELP